MSVCSACGFDNAPSAKFCSECGASLTAAAPQREERKVVTVLFADLVGFTSRAEHLDPEDVRAVLSPYYQRLRVELARFGGTVEKFIGDAVMALFGAPVAHEDDPERAVRAALAIRDAIGELNRLDESLDLRIRLGVTTGEALVSLGARPELGEGMASGDVVNTAARLQAAAPVNGVLVDDPTYRATRRAIDYGEHAPVEAKGKSEPIAVWQARSQRARTGVDVVQTARAPLVGRARELRVLLDAVARAHEQREPQRVTIIGVPGIGKSRLTWELFLAVDQSDLLTYWRQGRSLPYGAGIAFWALGEMVKAHAGILDTDGAAETNEKLAGVLAAALGDDERGWVLRHLRSLVGVGDDELAGDHRGEIFAAWRRFVEAVAEERPLVLVFEDLHWADEGLLDFIDYLSGHADDVPLLILGTARPELLERRPGWGAGRLGAQLVSLSALSDDESAQLVEALLDRVALPDDVQTQLLARTAGNPLYAEQYVRMLVESGALVRRNGGWALERGAELSAPESLHALIASRLDALPPEEKALLEDAAVVGKVFWTGALAAVGVGERSTIEDRLHSLGRKDFVRRERRSSVGGETEYAFRHVLVRDAAYGLIPRASRAERHRRVAEWLEALSEERAEDVADMLAHHYSSALDYARAARQGISQLVEPARRALQAAGDRAAGLNAFATAAAFYRRSLDLSSEDDPERAQLLFALGSALYFGEDTGVDELEKAHRGLLAQGRREDAALAKFYIAELAWRQGGGEALRERFENVLALLADEPPSVTKGYVLATAGFFIGAGTRREHDQGIQVCREGASIAAALGRSDVQGHALILAGCIRVIARDFGGLDEMREGLELAKSANSPYALVGFGNLAACQWSLGQVEESLQLTEEASAFVERFSEHWYARWLRSEHIMLEYYRGRWDDALAVADAVSADQLTGSRLLVGWVRGAVAIARGDVALVAAADELTRAATEIEEPIFRIPAAALASFLSLHAGEVGRAGGLFTDALLRWRQTEELPADWALELAYVSVSLGEEGRFLEVARNQPHVTPWLEAAVAAAEGDLPSAADVLARIGAEPDGAYARLLAAERLADEGRSEQAGAQAELALAYHRTVGASAYVARAETLLAAVA
jgi:class 3 adenylate cyclase